MEVELVSDSDVKSGYESESRSGSEFGSNSVTASKPRNESKIRSSKEKRDSIASNKFAKQVSSKGSPRVHSNPVLRVPRRKHLLNLMSARQQNLEQAKRDLLTLVEHNQQKRKRPSNQKESTNKNSHYNKTETRSSKTHSQSTELIEACKVLSVDIDIAESFINVSLLNYKIFIITIIIIYIGMV